MRTRHSIALACSVLLVAACDGGDDATGNGSDTADGGASDRTGRPTSDCAVAYSCTSLIGGVLFSCVETSASAEGARAACEAQSAGGVEYRYSTGHCEPGALAGCMIQEGEQCQVSWLYGESMGGAAGVPLHDQQCAAQGHTPVSQ